MKTILVDAIGCLVNSEGQIFEELHNLLDGFPNAKIVLTNANDEQAQQFGLTRLPYPVFSLKHNPDKTDPVYYETMLKTFGMQPGDVVYFEHSPEAKASAESAGITTYYYDSANPDLGALEDFLKLNLQEGGSPEVLG